MLRKAFRMKVNPGREEEYAGRHNPIWTEMADLLRRHGVHDYSIFLDPDTNDLFAYVQVEGDEQWAAIAATDICRRWWGSMRELMPTNADGSPQSRDLREVFHFRAGDEPS